MPALLTPSDNYSFSQPESPASRPRMHSVTFTPRPFPPPALAGVPLEYIIDQLHRLAPHYWSKPETADCTILVPLVIAQIKPGSTSAPAASSDTDMMFDSGKTGRRGAEPALRPAPRMVMKVHMDYLSAHSTLLRRLFSGASPLDPLASTPSASATSPAPSAPRLLPSRPAHPTVYLPVPDPSSLGLLVHYMYFGSTSFIEDALDARTTSWEGIARNVEYLQLGLHIKACLGRWYGRWRRSRGECGTDEHDEYDEYDTDSDCDSDSDAESDVDSLMDGGARLGDEVSPSATSTGTRMEDEQAEALASLAECEEPLRGRKRAPRRLGHSTSDPGPVRELYARGG